MQPYILLAFVLTTIAEPQESVKVEIKNNKTVALKLIWLKNKATSKRVATLNPGESRQIQTYLGHRFQVDIEQGDSLYFEVIHPGGQSIEFDETHSIFNLLGWRVRLNDKLWKHSPKLTRVFLNLMFGQLKKVVDAVPNKALIELQKVPIWINPPYENSRPKAEYHVSPDWLKNNGRDPDMAKSIEVTNVENFSFEVVRMPYLMLHELSHAYHDRVLDFRHPGIRTRFQAAKDSGSYENVKRFTGRTIVEDSAYALSNEREYFAESSEAYFGKNDFFPFDRKQLLQHDKAMHDLLESLWGIRE